MSASGQLQGVSSSSSNNEADAFCPKPQHWVPEQETFQYLSAYPSSCVLSIAPFWGIGSVIVRSSSANNTFSHIMCVQGRRREGKTVNRHDPTVAADARSTARSESIGYVQLINRSYRQSCSWLHPEYEGFTPAAVNGTGHLEVPLHLHVWPPNLMPHYWVLLWSSPQIRSPGLCCKI